MILKWLSQPNHSSADGVIYLCKEIILGNKKTKNPIRATTRARNKQSEKNHKRALAT